MSSKWGWVTLSIAVAGLTMFAASTSAQQQGRRGFFGERGIVTLATLEPVQKELDVGSDAKDKLSAIATEYRDEMREQMQSFTAGGFQNLSDEERQKLMMKVQETTQKLNAKYQPKVKEALSVDKFKRLQQISWQASGAAAFNDPEVVKALDLSKEQQEKISSVNQDFDKKLRALVGGGNSPEFFAKMRELSQERNKTAEEVLSKDQQAKFKELKGKEFDLAQLQQAPGAGGKGKEKDAKN